MKNYVAKSLLFGSMLAFASLCIFSVVRAEPYPSADPKPKARVQVLSSGSSSLDANPFGGYAPATVIRARVNQASAIRQAAEAVRDAKGDEEKSAAKKMLMDLLNKCYDEDMAQRERELKQIEERLTKLRELLNRRRAKKQDIIDLQTKVALNDADGLGFYDGDRPAKSTANPYFYAPVPTYVPRPAEPAPPAPIGPPATAAPRTNAPTSNSEAERFVDPTPSSDAEPLTPTRSR